MVGEPEAGGAQDAHVGSDPFHGRDPAVEVLVLVVVGVVAVRVEGGVQVLTIGAHAQADVMLRGYRSQIDPGGIGQHAVAIGLGEGRTGEQDAHPRVSQGRHEIGLQSTIGPHDDDIGLGQSGGTAGLAGVRDSRGGQMRPQGDHRRLLGGRAESDDPRCTDHIATVAERPGGRRRGARTRCGTAVHQVCRRRA